MRKRSGAIHSDTEQGFIQLASLSQDKTGIFYDQRVNRKITSLIQSIRPPLDHQIPLPIIQKQSETVPSTNCFAGFDFGLEHDEDRQEREELDRYKNAPWKEVNVGIISSQPQETMQHLCIILEEHLFQNSQKRGVDLIIHAEGSTTFKYWVFDRKSLHEKTPNILLELYLCHCSIVVDCCEANRQISILNTKLQEKEALISNRA